MKDRELVALAKKSDQYKGELYFRYEKLCFKHLHILERQLNYRVDVKEDFIGDTYEVFLKALEAVDMTSIKNDKWLFLGWYGFYLKNLRIKYMNDIIKANSKETSLIQVRKSGEEYILTDHIGMHSRDQYQEIDDRLTYEIVYKSFTPRQRKIADFKQTNYNNTEIARMLKISNTLVTIEMQKMKNKAMESFQ